MNKLAALSSLARTRSGRLTVEDCRLGAEWLLADERTLGETTDSLRGELLELLKTVVVHGARGMSVWCVRKRDGRGIT